MNNNYLNIVSELCNNNYDTYIVGGAVRDIFDNKQPHDIDIVTQATPEQIQQVFIHGHVVKTVGKSFGVTLVDGYEVATFRTDRHNTLLDARNVVVSFAKDIHEDLSRRDLTINALALCELTGELVDNHNGIDDLGKRLIRFVGDPEQRILEDPDRIIRAARFLAKLEGRFEQSTSIALKKHAALVGSHVAPERIRAEVLKAMELPVPSLFFSALHTIGALQYVLPHMEAAVDHVHGQYHAENVWEHLMLAGDHVSPKYPLVRLAAFLHDVGKPAAFKNDGTFHCHEIDSSKLVIEMLEKLRFSKDEVAVVSGLARSHMWCGHSGLTKKAVRKMRFRLSELSVDPSDWLRVRIADRAASVSKPNFTFSDIRERAEAIGIGNNDENAELPLTTHDLALSGSAIIQLFSVKGAAISALQKQLLSFVIVNGVSVNTKEALTTEARLLLSTE